MIRSRPEEAVQRAVVALLAVYERQGHLRFFAIPNQRGGRSRAEMGVLQALGVRAGVPDLVVLWDGGAGHIEIKRPGTAHRDSALSGAQKAWRRWLVDHGHLWACLDDVDDLLPLLREWTVLPDRGGG